MADARIKITADSAQAEATMRRLGDSADGLGGRFLSLTGLAGGLGGALSIGAFASFIKNTINGIDALNDLHDATGASIEMLSGLEDRAARTGTSMDTVGTALVKFNKVLEEAKPGSAAELALKQIGLSAEELKKIDPAEALRLTAVALAGYADDGNKARLVQELFGKSVREVAPLLKDLAEGGALAAKVTTEQAQAAEDFNKQLFELQKNAKDAGRSLVSDLLPSISAVLNEFKAGRESTTGFFDALFTLGTINPFRSQAENLVAYRKELEELQKTRVNYLDRGLSTRAIDADIEDVQKKLRYLKRLQMDAALQGGDSNQSAAESRRLGQNTAPTRSIKRKDANQLKQEEEDRKKGIEAQLKSEAAYLEAVQKRVDERETVQREQALKERKRAEESELAWQQGIAQRLAGIQTSNMSEEELARGHLTQIQNDLEAARNAGFITEQSYNELLYQETIKQQARLGDVEARGILARQQFEQMTTRQKTNFILGETLRMTQGVATHNRELFELNKIAGIANASINTYEGVTAALKLPPPFSFAMAAITLATGLAQVDAIASAQFGTSTSAPTIAGGGATPVFNAGASSPVAPLPAPNANIEPPKTQVNVTLVGNSIDYDTMVTEFIPLMEQASANGALDIRITRG